MPGSVVNVSVSDNNNTILTNGTGELVGTRFPVDGIWNADPVVGSNYRIEFGVSSVITRATCNSYSGTKALFTV